MTLSSSRTIDDLFTISPLDGLSPPGRQRLREAARLLRYGEGQLLSSADAIGDQVLVVLDGTARLLAERDGVPFTLERLRAGAIIGLASLLRAQACEQVNAASALLVAAIPDALMLELLRSEPELRRWCAQQLWTAELHALLSLRQSAQSAKSFDPDTWRHELESLRRAARAVAPEAVAQQPAGVEDELVLASGNVPDLPLGSVLPPGKALPLPRPPLPLRLVILPKRDEPIPTV